MRYRRPGRNSATSSLALGEEIAQAITSAPIGEPIDTEELEEELANIEQEALDDKMLKTGSVPIGDRVDRLPAAANGERKFLSGEGGRTFPFATRR